MEVLRGEVTAKGGDYLDTAVRELRWELLRSVFGRGFP